MAKPHLEHRPDFAGPLYVQVSKHLRQRIENLEWRSDMPMPNETLLARQMGVSVGTMRKALEALEASKVIVRRQGRGTYVIDSRIDTELERFPKLYADDLKIAAQSKQISCRLRMSAHEDASVLGPSPQQIVEILRTRHAPGRFVVAERIIVPHDLMDGLAELEDLSGALLFPTYRRDFHVVVEAVEETVGAVNLEADLAALLGVSPGRAALAVSRIATTASGTVAEWSIRYICLEPSVTRLPAWTPPAAPRTRPAELACAS